MGRRFLLYITVLALSGLPLFAQEADPAVSNTSPVTSIEVIGLKRTKPPIARYPLEKFIGRDAESLDLREVEAAVKSTNVLEPELIELADDPLTPGGRELRVTVREKWSIFPIPMVMASSGKMSAGLFLADTNALGRRDQAVVGGMYGSEGWSIMGLYNLTPDRRQELGWSIMGFYNRTEKEDTNREEEVFRRYTRELLTASTAVTYPFTDYFSASLGASFARAVLVKNDSDIDRPESGAMLLGIDLSAAIRNSGWDGFLVFQKLLSVKYQYNFALSGDPFGQFEYRAILEHSVVPGFKLALKTGGIWKPGAAPLFEEGPRAAQVDILPRDFSARHYAGGALGFEKYLLKTSQGVLSILGSWQLVWSRGPLSGTELDHGPAGGLCFYLSRLALPAMGFQMGYNIPARRSQFSFTMGMSF